MTDASPSDIPDFPQIPLLSRDPEQRKSPAGVYPLPDPQVVQARTESGGARLRHLEG